MDRDGWRQRGEQYIAKGQLRRALGAFRRAVELDVRGEKSFELHQLCAACAQLLSQRGAFYLHPSDETARNRALHTPVEPDFTKLAAQARALGHDELALRLEARALPPSLADQPLGAGLKDEAFSRAARDAQLWLYEALLDREEPSPVI